MLSAGFVFCSLNSVAAFLDHTEMFCCIVDAVVSSKTRGIIDHFIDVVNHRFVVNIIIG